MAVICDNCGGKMVIQDDDSLYCPYCGYESDNSWVACVPPPDEWPYGE
jgi:hypothetical protein